MLMTNGNLPLTTAQKQAIIDYVRNGQGARRRPLRDADAVRLSRVRRVARRLLPALDRADRANRRAPRRRAEGRGSESSRHENARRQLAARRRVLPVRHGGVGREPAHREHRARSDACRFRWRSRATASTCCSASTPRRPTSAIWAGDRKGGDYPQAWTRTDGRGRVFYTALGHRDDIWSNDPVFRAHVAGGIRWALSLEP